MAHRTVAARKRSRFTVSARSSVHAIDGSAPLDGWIEGAPADPRSWRAAELEVDLSAFRTGNRLLDGEARRRMGDDRLVRATSTEVVDVQDGEVALEGLVTFRGVTELLEGRLTIEPTEDGVRIRGVGEVDVRWWGLDPPRLLMLQVEPVVTVGVDLWFPGR